MIQIKDYDNFDVPYDPHLPVDFWDEWWAVRITYTDTSRSKVDRWCENKWGWFNPDYMNQSKWFRFVGTDV